MSVFTIGVTNAEFYAFHGVYEEENLMGHHFVVNFSIDFERDRFEYENLGSTINYETMYQIIKAEMDKPRKLLESVASDILQKARENWQHALHCRIKIEKIGVQLGGKVQNSFVSLSD
ncbi:MAG: dihydroneopterin aldolase [Saprospiraceae bacterium]|nr:dihydroneopterin aldolase [Saprospiraceae bacterium]